MALRTLETTAESIVDAGDMAPEFLKNVLSSVTSPGLLDVVIIYRNCDFGGWMSICRRCGPPYSICYCHDPKPAVRDFHQQLRVSRQMRRVRDFRLVFCVDVYNYTDDGVRLLGSVVEKEVVEGEFNHLSYSPVVICERQTIRTRPGDDYAGSRSYWVPASAL